MDGCEKYQILHGFFFLEFIIHSSAFLFLLIKLEGAQKEGKKTNPKPRKRTKYESSVAAQLKSQRAAASAACLRVGARAHPCLSVSLTRSLTVNPRSPPPTPPAPPSPPPGAGLCVELNLNAEQERRALSLSPCIYPDVSLLRARLSEIDAYAPNGRHAHAGCSHLLRLTE